MFRNASGKRVARAAGHAEDAFECFPRPVAYQDVPDSLLPSAVREPNPDALLRMVDDTYIHG